MAHRALCHSAMRFAALYIHNPPARWQSRVVRGGGGKSIRTGTPRMKRCPQMYTLPATRCHHACQSRRRVHLPCRSGPVPFIMTRSISHHITSHATKPLPPLPPFHPATSTCPSTPHFPVSSLRTLLLLSACSTSRDPCMRCFAIVHPSRCVTA